MNCTQLFMFYYMFWGEINKLGIIDSVKFDSYLLDN